MKIRPQEDQIENISLLDIIDINFLQKFQDSLAKTLNIASVMIDKNGPITTPSNFSEFCSKYIRQNELGGKRCLECDIKYGNIASEQGKPVVYTCHAGLTDFAVPIMINGKHIASIFGGQILTKEPDEEGFRQKAKELNIDEKPYLEALRKIKVMHNTQITSAAELLFIAANSISEMAQKNLELKIKSEKEKTNIERELLIRKISENIRSSLDINKTLSYICDELAQVFKVQRATIIQYHNMENLSEFEVRREYKSNSSITGILNNPTFNWDVGGIWAKALEGDGHCLAIDDIAESDLPEFFKKNYASIGQKSIIIAPIMKDSIKWGVIILSEYDYNRHWTDDDISLLNLISSQIYVAINQSELYLTIQKKAYNENVLRKIISSSVNDFDTSSIINSVLTETCNLFEADRCIFIAYNSIDDSKDILTSYSEYVASPEIVPASEIVPEKAVIDAIVDLIKKREVVISNDVLHDELLEETKHTLIDVLSVQSFLVAPVYYGDIEYGAIALHYVKHHKHFNSEEIEFVKAIANQAAAVIHQAKLYKKIEKNEKYTRTVLNNIKDAIITTDENFIIESCNPAIEDIWGYSVSECHGKKICFLFDCDEAEFNKNINSNPKGISGRRADGTVFAAEIALSKVVTDSKNLNLFVIRDITERVKVEQMKNEFVSTVSHELRTPLTSIRGALGLLSSGKVENFSDKTLGLLDIAGNNCLRLINLINDILDIEKIEAGKMSFDLKTVNLKPIVEQAVQANLQYAQKFNVELNLISALKDTFVKVDSDRLIQVLTNLLSNAIKFSESTNSVEITEKKHGGNVFISITNYGKEISDEFKTRIFQKFAQADSSDARKKGGTGLGLSISKAIIEKMNGRIGFISENQKTTFYFVLPEVIDSNEEN